MLSLFFLFLTLGVATYFEIVQKPFTLINICIVFGPALLMAMCIFIGVLIEDKCYSIPLPTFIKKTIINNIRKEPKFSKKQQRKIGNNMIDFVNHLKKLQNKNL